MMLNWRVIHKINRTKKIMRIKRINKIKGKIRSKLPKYFKFSYLFKKRQARYEFITFPIVFNRK